MDTQRILFADSQPAGAGLVLLFSPDGLELEAARVVDSPAGAPRVMEAAVLRPINLLDTHGVNIRREDIAEMAEAYDPVKVEAAALNFDHAWGGPSHGWATKLWVEGEFLWARFENLSQEAADAIASGRWPRRSSEFWLKHPQTGGAYLTGLALLGNASPACSGLPPARLMARQPIRIDLTKESPMDLEATPEAAPPIPLEDNVLPPTVEETPAPAEGDPGDAAVDLSADLVDRGVLQIEREALAAQAARLEIELASLEAARAALAADTAIARRERVAVEVDRDLAKLTGLPPAALRTGLRGALIELRLAEPLAVQLSADLGGGSKSVAEILFAALATLPPIGVLAMAGGGELAPASADPTETSGDHRTESERQVHLRARLDDTRYLELRQKYGFSEIN